jgi:hypothetical protein
MKSEKAKSYKRVVVKIIRTQPAVIVDCNYTFKEAIARTKAPQNIVSELTLITVQYYSTDKKLHQRQILTNRNMSKQVQQMFDAITKLRFPIAHAIPIVKYNWDDEASMEANNTYSFCYRNASYSKHAIGMAIDINPLFNPVRWKVGYRNRPNRPVGATLDSCVEGKFYTTSPVVEEFKQIGFHWGHYFPKKYDDHHFEL